MKEGIWKYSELLPDVREESRLTIGEGHTPLVKSRRLQKELGLRHLYFKLESSNPTGSYKDRFAAVGISDLIQKQSRFCIATSSGNAGAALSAYCAAADIRCFLAIVDGAPEGKLLQIKTYGGEALMVKGFGIDIETSEGVMDGLKEITNYLGIPVYISAYHYSPVAMAGVQTIAFEIAEELPAFNGSVFCPVGGGGLALSLIRGFDKWTKINTGFSIPKVHPVQPEGNDTIIRCLNSGFSEGRSIPKSLTAVSGLQVPNVIDGNDLIRSCRSIGGNGFSVSDELVFECQEMMARKEGIYSEPAGTVALAGLVKSVREGTIDKDKPVICIVSGNGFKDLKSTEKIAAKAEGKYFNSTESVLGYIKDEIR